MWFKVLVITITLHNIGFSYLRNAYLLWCLPNNYRVILGPRKWTFSVFWDEIAAEYQMIFWRTLKRSPLLGLDGPCPLCGMYICFLCCWPDFSFCSLFHLNYCLLTVSSFFMLYSVYYVIKGPKLFWSLMVPKLNKLNKMVIFKDSGREPGKEENWRRQSYFSNPLLCKVWHI